MRTKLTLLTLGAIGLLMLPQITLAYTRPESGEYADPVAAEFQYWDSLTGTLMTTSHDAENSLFADGYCTSAYYLTNPSSVWSNTNYAECSRGADECNYVPLGVWTDSLKRLDPFGDTWICIHAATNPGSTGVAYRVDAQIKTSSLLVFKVTVDYYDNGWVNEIQYNCDYATPSNNVTMRVHQCNIYNEIPEVPANKQVRVVLYTDPYCLDYDCGNDAWYATGAIVHT